LIIFKRRNPYDLLQVDDLKIIEGSTSRDNFSGPYCIYLGVPDLENLFIFYSSGIPLELSVNTSYLE
jgi:hypothetical protein